MMPRAVISPAVKEQAIHISAPKRQPPPLTLYIHLPWCKRKCPYCDFNSHTAAGELPEDEYIKALTADLISTLPAVWGRELSAIFIGGGTPSLFSAAAIDSLLTQVRALFNFSPLIEVTLEVNPESAAADKFAGYRTAGVNRLSLGVQSFDDNYLQNIGRLHNGDTARQAAAAAVATFDNVNIDLMHALPAQNIADAVADVRTAIAYAPSHLSLYQLTLEPQTPFYRTPPPDLPDDDTTADITDAVAAQAQAGGYCQYEVSAYAKGERRCLHNLNYWQFGDYLGIGAGAHSKITAADGVRREERIKHPRYYMQQLQETGSAIRSTRKLSSDALVFEFMLNALRLSDGFSTALLNSYVPPTRLLQRGLAAAEEQGLLTHSVNSIRPTAKGRRYLNSLTALFLAEENTSDYAGE